MLGRPSALWQREEGMLRKAASLTLLTLIILAAFAADSYATKLAGEFLQTGIGAKALGMGSAYVSVADDASGSYWNPAGLVGQEKRQLLLQHSRRFGDLVNYNAGVFSRPLSTEEGKESAGGISIVWLRVSDIAFTSHLNEPNVDFIDDDGDGVWDPGEKRIWDPSRVRWESDNEVAGWLSYGRRVSPSIVLGINGKVIWKDIGDISATGFGLDLSLIQQLKQNWKWGFNLQDATTTPLYWSGSYTTIDEETGEEYRHKVDTKETIYPTFKVGTSYVIISEAIAGQILLAFDIDFKFEGLDSSEADFALGGTVSGDVMLGGRYRYKDILHVSAGMNRQQPTGGIGVTIGSVDFDYAFWPHESLDNTHRISLTVSF
jgi:hypothetical protein